MHRSLGWPPLHACTREQVHNMEFLAWAAMLAGNKGAALAAAGQIETFLDEARLGLRNE